MTKAPQRMKPNILIIVVAVNKDSAINTGTMPVYDVIIVGAGPAGSSAAYDLASAGANVLIIDKENFPRDKPCGGGLTTKTINALRFDVSEVIYQECNRISLTNNFRHPVKDTASQTIAYMTKRRDFDQFCLDKALKAGARFSVMSITHITGQNGQAVTLMAQDGRKITTSFVVAADGAKSTVRRIALSKKDRLRYAFALEGRVAIPEKYDRQRLDFDFFMVPHGYGWVFPKGDHLNIGIGNFRDKSEKGKKISKKILTEYCRKKFGHAEIEDVIGHPLGGGGWSAKVSSDRILFVGDAAGTVDSLLGEGIYNAIISGQAAARAILEAMKHNNCPMVLTQEYEALFNVIRKDLAFCNRVGKGFYGFPSLFYLSLLISPLRRRLLESFASGKTVSGKKGLTGRIFNFPETLLSAD
ncbi:hypothetical protein MNBD_ALPHA01-1140 [hydrothermal vent metagenome]|uniref:FAD-binding domain-containing protein n=1 Tax=hydrothermal vent metagenome TaxID=652676 RepID=A0A3B0SYQ5_9ZZZZ